MNYKGQRLKQTYKPEFVCFGKVILEIKAITALGDEHRAQVHNHLKATGGADFVPVGDTRIRVTLQFADTILVCLPRLTNIQL